MKLKLTICLLFFFSISCVLAYQPGNVAYIVRNPLLADANIISILNYMGFTVDVVPNTELTGVNWSDYQFIIVNDEIFSNSEDIPVNNVKALILNTWNINDFHWSRRASQYASSHPVEVINQVPGHIITNGLSTNITVYTTAKLNGANLYVNYLSRDDKAPKLTTIVSTIINSLHAVIAVAEKGTKLRDGVYANEKGVFFGITFSDDWTPEAELLFKNSVEWLMTDTSPPVILGNVTVEELTESAAVVSWVTDDESDSRVDYGKTSSLGSTKYDSALVTKHRVVLTGLDKTTTYYFNVTSCNEYSYCTTAGMFNFTTLDLTPPVIISINVINITNHSFKAEAITDEPSIAEYYLGTHPANLQLLSYDAGYYLEHNLRATGLEEHTLYYYMLRICDSSGNCVNSSVYNLTTKDFTPPGAPVNFRAYVINSNNDILLNWSAPQGEQVAYYNIYTSDIPGDFDFTQPEANTTELSWIDSTAKAVDKRFYVVRAVDAYGNEEKNENIVGKFDIELVPGLNLVSLPLIPFDAEINAVVHQDSGFYPITEITRLNSSGDYESILFEPTTESWVGSTAFTELHNGVGYFFRANKQYKFTITGRPALTTQTLTLQSGINLVGLTTLNSYTIPELVQQNISYHPVSEVFKLNSNSYYISATYYPDEQVWWYYPEQFELQPGHGYVFKNTAGVSVSYEP